MDKICVCAIAKLENRYVREWVGWYVDKLGVDKIFLYDNNEINGERFEDVINDYIDYGVVELIDYRGETSLIRQLIAYEDCYLNHKDEYEWFLFVDIDEFIINTTNLSLYDFLQQDKFKFFNLIHLCWKIYDDNDYINDNPQKTPVERFTREVGGNYITHVKSAVRGGLRGVFWAHLPNRDPHTIYSTELRCCFSNGNKKDQRLVKFQRNEACYDNVFIAHYYTKSLEEWLEYKVKRQHPSKNEIKIEEYFNYNIRTKEKEDFIEQWKKDQKLQS